MKFEKVKYTAQYEGIHRTNEWISIDVTLEGEETPEMGLDAAKQKIEGWHSANTGQIPIINKTDRLAHNDNEFNALKAAIDLIPTKTEAMAYLSTTDFRLSIEAKNYINSTKL